MPLADFPREPLSFGPSPLQPLDAPDGTSAVRPIWAKREDCQLRASPSAATRPASSSTSSPMPWPRARTRSCPSVASSRTTPARSRPSRRTPGLRCVLVQESWVDWPDVIYDRVGNIQLRASWAPTCASSGRLRHRLQGELGAGPRGCRGRRGAHPMPSRRAPRTTAWAASASPLGGRAREQEQELGVFFDTVIVCSVTGSTQAGDDRRLRCPRVRGRRRRIIGIDGSATPVETRDQVAASRGRPRRSSRSGESCATTRSSSMTGITRARTASQTRRRSTRSGWPAGWRGLIADPVYEGKSMAGMIDLVSRGEIGP